MPLFRKKPIIVEAHQWFKNGDHPRDGGSEGEGKVVRYFRNPYQPGHLYCGASDAGEPVVHSRGCGRLLHDHGFIDTLEGGFKVCPGDWIITGVKGENYPCKPDIFDATYEEVIPIGDSVNITDKP